MSYSTIFQRLDDLHAQLHHVLMKHGVSDYDIDELSNSVLKLRDYTGQRLNEEFNREDTEGN